MHPVMTIKNGTHHLHDGMLNMWHRISQELRSRQFWADVGIVLLVLGFVALLYLLTRDIPVVPYHTMPYSSPYVAY